MRSAINRHAKYSAKVDGDVAKNRIDAQRDSMIEQEAVHFASLVELEASAKEVLNTAAGVHSIQIASYLAFARKIWKITNTHGTGNIGTEEAQEAANTFHTRGLTWSVLISLAAISSVTVTSA